MDSRVGKDKQGARGGSLLFYLLYTFTAFHRYETKLVYSGNYLVYYFYNIAVSARQRFA
jgi:hypothetical protein